MATSQWVIWWPTQPVLGDEMRGMTHPIKKSCIGCILKSYALTNSRIRDYIRLKWDSVFVYYIYTHYTCMYIYCVYKLVTTPCSIHNHPLTNKNLKRRCKGWCVYVVCGQTIGPQQSRFHNRFVGYICFNNSLRRCKQLETATYLNPQLVVVFPPPFLL